MISTQNNCFTCGGPPPPLSSLSWTQLAQFSGQKYEAVTIYFPVIASILFFVFVLEKRNLPEKVSNDMK